MNRLFTLILVLLIAGITVSLAFAQSNPVYFQFSPAAVNWTLT